MAAKGQTFDFFGLPRELRDEIYLMLAVDTDPVGGINKCNRPKDIQVGTERGPFAKLLRLNRQLKSEYEEQLQGTHHYSCNNFRSINARQLLTYPPSLLQESKLSSSRTLASA